MISNNLRIFIVVAEKGSFTAAADELYITQPAVSRAVKSVEDDLGIKLFHRDKRKGVFLTDAGSKILLLARQMAEIENRMFQTAFRENGFLGGKVCVASMPILASAILSKVFRRFRDTYPGVALEMTEGTSSEVKRAVDEHRADFGFAATPFDGLDSKIVLKDRMVAATIDDSLAGRTVKLDEGKGLVLCRAGYETVLEGARGGLSRLSESMVVNHVQTAISFVEQGNGIGVISEFVLDVYDNPLLRMPVDPPVEMEFGLIAHDLDDLTPAAKALTSMIVEECGRFRQSVGQDRPSFKTP